MSFKPLNIVFLALMLFLSGCGWQMSEQPRYDSYEPLKGQPEKTSSRKPPAGTVLFQSRQKRPALTEELLRRGEERYNIYCSVCHGATGHGDGRIVQHGFPAPPSFHSEKLKAADDLHFWSAITNGAGRMYPYANRVSPEDRWAIVEWVRVLQMAEVLKKEQNS